MPEPKDIILGILGASVSLAGLLLVFCGFLLTQADGFPSSTKDTLIAKYRRAGKLGLVPFMGTLIVAGTSTAWLLCPLNWVFWLSVDGFIAILVATAVYGGVAIWGFA